MRSPASLDGVGHPVHPDQPERGLDEHCAAARAAGARIVDEPTDQFYGARTYRAIDPKATSGTSARRCVVSGEEMEQATGLRIATSLPEGAS
jgi:hypothetical protein